MKYGILLINLGTPNNPSKYAVRNYLKTFLTDYRVIDIPLVWRYILVYLFILPFRTKRSAEAYSLIWTSQGSPLLYHSQNVSNELQKQMGLNYKVILGMRYGFPSIEAGLNQLKHCDSILILPLYPQYSSAATGSSIERCLHIIQQWNVIPAIKIIKDFYDHPEYIKAQCIHITKYIDDSFVLFSYHGIPERQLIKAGCEHICQESCPTDNNHNSGLCYKAQCFQTSNLIAKTLKLQSTQFATSFQSRLGKTPWIRPYTDEILQILIKNGVKKLHVVCPSFVVDCLETIEEIGIRLKSEWFALGGESFKLIPCLNENPEWIKSLIKICSDS